MLGQTRITIPETQPEARAAARTDDEEGMKREDAHLVAPAVIYIADVVHLAADDGKRVLECAELVEVLLERVLDARHGRRKSRVRAVLRLLHTHSP